MHEAAHGYTAYLLGDDTARQDGRLSFNPLHHIDPLGFLCLILFHFGWARPVRCDASKFKHPRLGMAAVAAAGPLSNFILAFVLMLSGMLVFMINNRFCAALAVFLMITAQYSIFLGIFNAIPLPILDGFHIISPLLPRRVLEFVYRYQHYMWLLLIVLIYSDVLSPFLSSAAYAVYDMIYRAAVALISVF